jgi:energy-coupling factor transporter ATP-binding protein EcfA2
VKDLAGYANLKTNRDKRLFTAYAVTVLLSHIGRPIFNASGAMGSGKTTLQRLLKRLVDPTAPETVRLDARDFLQKAAHAYALILDNQNTIPEWASDTLCRLVTGEADSKRRLYTDDEDVIVELRRAVLLNGINVPTDRGDVLDRSLVVELERIPDAERRTEEELWESFEAEHPKLLGALFDVLSQAIARKPSIKLSRRPRLADWGEYAAAVYEVMGWGAETFLKDWDEVVKVQNQATLDGSPVAQAIIKFMEDKDEYTGTSSKLHKSLAVVAEDLGLSKDKAWPKSARWLWKRIKEVLPVLAAAGFEASRAEDRTGSKITLRKVPMNDATNATREDNRGDKPKDGGIKVEDDATANATTDGSNATGGNTTNANATSNPTGDADSYAGSGNSGISGNRSGGSWQGDPMRHYGRGGSA